MKIEAGKFYKTRDGRKVGPMIYVEEYEGDGYPFNDCVIDGWWSVGGLRQARHLDGTDLIAEWTDTPPTWGELTDAEKRDISFAAMCGKVIELGGDFGWHQWDKTTPLCDTHQPLRIKPEPVVEAVAICWRHDTPTTTRKIGTMQLKDVEPDLASIKMEKL